MATVGWSEAMSVGNVVIDEQHRHFITLLDDLSNASEANLPALVDELVQYINYHFDTEEEMMASVSYPLLEEHRELHRGFIMEVSEMCRRLFEGLLTVEDVKSVVSEWCLDHIAIEDKKYMSYI